MARSRLADALRDARKEREARMTADERSRYAYELAVQGVRDYAATHGITYGDARRRLKAAVRAGRTPTSVFGDV